MFSGIEAATAAWQPLGWQCAGFSEIEPFPCAVLKNHYPGIPNLGDVTRITESQIKKLGTIDLIIFGSPCQDLSVAGNRKGFDGERSSLFRDAIRIIKWARKHCGCRFALWENVPGAFSSNKGRDFAEVLKLLTGTDQHSPERWRYAGAAFGKEGFVEWRVCDAQFYGVPQRRRRIFALADFGNWAGRYPILFESPCLSGNSQASGETGETITTTTGGNIDCTSTGIAGTVSSKWSKGTGGPAGDEHYNLVAIPIHDKATRHASKRGDKQDGAGNGLGIGSEGAPMNTLTSGDRHAISFKSIVRRLTPIECERLQGFPDNYTQIPWKNKPAEDCPDGPRYRALGNSIAVPVLVWIGQQLNSYQKDAE